MSGLFGGGSGGTNTVDAQIGALRINTSAYGKAIALCYGKSRIAGNLIWYSDFLATPHTTTSGSGGGKGGSGGGASSSQTSWTYSAAALMGLCEGAISDAPTIWADKAQYSQLFVGAQTTATTESFTVPSSPYQVTVANAANYAAPDYVSSGTSLSRFSIYGNYFTDVSPATPANSGEYKRVGGIYTFYAGDVGLPVAISYHYTIPAHVLSGAGQLGLSIYTGTPSQTPFGYVTANHPGEALGYRRLAYAAAGSYYLGDSASMPNHTFEVDALLPFSAAIRDANPAAILPDYLTDPYHGVGFPAGKIGDLTQWSNSCIANGLFLSPGYTSQEQASGPIERLAQCSNAALVFSEGVLKVLPYGDTAVSGNGVTYTPNTTPLYALTDDDFLDAGGDPVIVVRGNPADAFNQVQLQYNNRANQYNQDVVEAKDQANIELYGLRPMSPVTMDEIVDTAVARAVVQLILQRVLHIRNTYRFPLGWRYCLLEPMDIVTLTESSGDGLNNVPVRITLVEENEDGTFNLEAEDYIGGVSSHVAYPTQLAGGYSANYQVAPGRVNPPIIFDAPGRMTDSGYEVWLAVAGTGPFWGGANLWISTDGETYVLADQIAGPSRYGYLQATMAAGVDPDTASSAAVDFTTSAATMVSGTIADADNLTTLCWCDGELFSYQSAALTAKSKYTLGGYLRRGVYGTTITSHELGKGVVRLDGKIVRYAYPPALIGQQIWVKFCSYNIYGVANETLDVVVPYTFTIGGPIGRPDTVTGLMISGNVLTWTGVAEHDLAGYRAKFQYGSNLDWGTAAALHDGLVTDSPYTLKVRPVGTATIMLRAVDTAGNESANSAYVIADLGDALVANVIESMDFGSAGWPGMLTNAAITGGNIVATQSDQFFSADAREFYGYDGAPFFSTNHDGLTWISGGWTPDLAAVGSNLTATWTLTGNTPAIEYRFTGPSLFFGTDLTLFYGADTDPFFSGPSDWQMWPGSLSAQAQEYQWRVTTRSGETAGLLSAFIASVDVPDLSMKLTGVVIAAGGTRLSAAAGRFTAIQNIQLTLQDGSGAVSLAIQDRSTSLGPLIIAKNSAGTSVTATIDALIQGY